MDKYNYSDESNAEKLENVNPTLYKKVNERQVTADDENEDVVDEFDAREVFGAYTITFTFNSQFFLTLIIAI